jgi:hypothetical protein
MFCGVAMCVFLSFFLPPFISFFLSSYLYLHGPSVGTSLPERDNERMHRACSFVNVNDCVSPSINRGHLPFVAGPYGV